MNALVISLLALGSTLHGDWPAPEDEKRIDIDVKEMKLANALRLFSEMGKFNLIVSEDLKELDANVTLRLRDVPVSHALEAVLQTQDLRAIRRGNLVTILAPEEPAKEKAEALEKLRRRKLPERVRIGGDVLVREDEEVSEAVAVGGSVEIRGRAREAVAVGGDLRVSGRGEVEDEAVVVGGRLIIEQGGKVGGEQVEIAPSNIPRRVLGALLGLREHHASEREGFAKHAFGAVGLFIVYFVLGLVLVALTPRRLEAVGATLFGRPGKSGLAGLASAIVACLLCAMLCVTLIGIPLALLLLVAVMGVGFFGMTALALALGRRILPNMSAVLVLALGTVLLVALHHIPWVGMTLLGLAALMSFGAAVLSRVGAPGAGAA